MFHGRNCYTPTLFHVRLRLDWLLEIQDLGTPMTSQRTHTHVYCINPMKYSIPNIPERKGYTRMLQFNFQPNLLKAREIICFKVIIKVLHTVSILK